MTNSSSLRGRVVLVVEDDYFQAVEIRAACTENGAVVLGPVGRLDEALALINDAARIDGAVLDINLHEAKIFPVADILHNRGVPFVFATGYERAAIPARFANVPKCEKPIDPEAIVAALFG
jgi:DNA-binding LytR/AlgR family response regulator